MLCAQYDKKEKLIIKDIEPPKITSDEALVKVDACGVCGSDLVKIKKGLIPEGTVLGHEVVGTIIETGGLIRNWSEGQKVVVAHHVPCLGCHYCKSGNFSMCKQFKETNFAPGGFAEYIKLSRKHLDQTTFLIPKGTVEDGEMSLTEPLACCLRAVEESHVTASNTILVSGLGSIGNLLGKLCTEKSAHVYGVDLMEERINFAKEFNSIHEGYTPGSKGFKKSVLERTEGRGVDIVFLASGSEKSIADAIELVRSGGKIIIFSSIPRKRGFDNNEIYYRELTIKGSYSPSPVSLKEAYQLLITGKLKLSKLISDIVSLEELPSQIDKCLTSESMKMIVKNQD